MADPKGILFFLDDLDAMELLTDEEKGRLFTALLMYARGDKDLNLTGNEKFLFPSFRSRIDRDRKKYQEKCEKNRENARKRSHSDGANDSDGKRTQANANDGSDGKRTQPIIKEKEEEEKSKDKSKSKNKKEEESISLSNQDIGKGCGENPEPDVDPLYLGMYGNVVLTPYDYERLNNSFPDCDAAINRLSIKLFKGASLNCSHSEFLFGYLTDKLVKGQKVTDPAIQEPVPAPEPERKNRDMNFEDLRKQALAKLSKGGT